MKELKNTMETKEKESADRVEDLEEELKVRDNEWSFVRSRHLNIQVFNAGVAVSFYVVLVTIVSFYLNLK